MKALPPFVLAVSGLSIYRAIEAASLTPLAVLPVLALLGAAYLIDS